MPKAQPAIVLSTPPYARYLTFRARDALDARLAVDRVARLVEAKLEKNEVVVGFSEPLLSQADYVIPGHASFPEFSFGDTSLPRSQGDVWLWLRGDDRAALLASAEEFERGLEAEFWLVENMEAFTYAGGRDLTGYEDGTENPKGERLESAAFVGEGALRGGAFVAVQRWAHSLGEFARLSKEERDAIIGRERDTNDEIAEAPESAHVKRTAQESFEPEAFVLRRSMPWLDGGSGGLYFVAFASSFTAFDAQMRRMTGEADGIVDGLFRFSKPLTGAYYFCPPLEAGSLVFSGS